MKLVVHPLEDSACAQCNEVGGLTSFLSFPAGYGGWYLIHGNDSILEQLKLMMHDANGSLKLVIKCV